MKQNDIVIVLAAFVAYLILMVVVGAVYMKKTKNSEDYFLGGRGLSGWVAALSAQASDMSGWLDGIAGNRLCTWNRSGMDCCRFVFRNGV